MCSKKINMAKIKSFIFYQSGARGEIKLSVL
jgi:hypothetical protein